MMNVFSERDQKSKIEVRNGCLRIIGLGILVVVGFFIYMLVYTSINKESLENGKNPAHVLDSQLKGDSTENAHDFYCENLRNEFVAQAESRGVPKKDAIDVWYDTQLTMKFRDVDCGDFARRKMKTK